MTIALAIDHLACIRGARVVFRDLSLKASQGTLVAVEGPNGAGKTSLLRLIAGLLRPAAGSIALEVEGAMLTDGEERGVHVGWLGHHDGVKPQLSVREQAAFWSALFGAGRDPDQALQRFGLGALAHLPGQFLSAGQRRRLALARLWLSDRPLWLLDEPLSALDAGGRALVIDAIGVRCATGGIVLAATHEPLGLPCTSLRLEGTP